MKKKIVLIIVFIVLLFCTTYHVYANTYKGDAVKIDFECNDKEKFQKFEEFLNLLISDKTVQGVLLLIIGVALLLSIIVLLNKKDKIKVILSRIYLGINIILSSVSIYMLRILKLFEIECSGKSYSKLSLEKINQIVIILFIFYFITLILWYIIARKGKIKSKKIIYILTLIITILFAIISFKYYDSIKVNKFEYKYDSLMPKWDFYID